MKKFIAVFCLFFVVSQLCASDAQIIVFVQTTSDQHFIETTLPKIRSFSAEQGIELVECDAANGIPEEITSTPAIIFQNASGRSIYAARYATFSTIENFIRTSRFFPQVQAKNCKEAVLLFEEGRTKVIAPVKITEATGKLPKGFSSADFMKTMDTTVKNSMQQLNIQSKVCIERTDRAFYMDFYPYIDKDSLFLTTALFSQFSCIDPVFTTMGKAVKGPIADAKAIIEKASQQLETELFYQLEKSIIGDAISTIDSDIPIKEWEDLKLALPKSNTANSAINISPIDLSGDWTYSAPVAEEIPVVQFRFMAPLDRYTGEVKKLTGNINIDAEGKMQSGYFEVATQSLTMGSPDFDKKIWKSYIDAFRYPKSSFRFSGLSDAPKLKPGETTILQVNGFFKMMKTEIPMPVDVQLTPLIDDAGKPFIQVNAAFEMNIKKYFGIKGPDGPAPAKETVQLRLNFLMRPV